MNSDLSCLQDPVNYGPLQSLDDSILTCKSGESYPIINGIPRFVPENNYANAFGEQWNRFPKIQLDSYNGQNLSETRLARCMRGHLADLKGKMVLEVGSGAGRFTEILLKHGAIVHSLDYSIAVDANRLNNGQHENLTLVQADIRRIPFPKASYDYVVCLGVIQHTPNSEESINCLWEMVKPGGHLVIDHYRWNLGLILPPPIGGAESLYRWLILKLPMKFRFKAVKSITDFWFPVHWLFRKYSLIQRILVRLSPVHFYYPQFEFPDRQTYYELALLDTYDGTTDFYKHYRNESQIEKFLEKIGAKDIEITVGGNGIEAFCRKSD